MSRDSEWDEAEAANDASSSGDDENYWSEEDKKPSARKTPPKKKPPPQPSAASSTKSSNNNSNKRKVKYVFQDEGGCAEDETGGTTGKKSDQRKRLRRVNFDAMDDQMDSVPANQRITDRGGYKHTKSSRMKISQKNSGNVPWNKGKNRSDDHKARISAGVKARNRAILIVKLQKLGMTEEEWYAKKKDLKLMREKVRKARIAAVKYREDSEKRMLAKRTKEQLDRATVELDALTDEDADEEQQSRKEEEELADTKPDAIDAEAAPIAENSHVFAPFPREYQWTPHVFDKPDVSYSMLCPHGGPGGLICCESCTNSYSKYLTKTVTDMEKQRIAHVGSEVRELLQFTRDAKSKLADSVKAARRKPVPMVSIASKTIGSTSKQLKDPPPALKEEEQEPSKDVPTMKTAVI